MIKKIILCTLIICANELFAQSISVSKLYHILKTQDNNTIKTILKNNGFTYSHIENDVKFYKKNQNSITEEELFAYGHNDELYYIMYVPKKSLYNTYKNLLLTPDFKYSYGDELDKYYENGKVRLGLSEDNMFLLFVNLRHK